MMKHTRPLTVSQWIQYKAQKKTQNNQPKNLENIYHKTDSKKKPQKLTEINKKTTTIIPKKKKTSKYLVVKSRSDTPPGETEFQRRLKKLRLKKKWQI